jgi:hypothetical protein
MVGWFRGCIMAFVLRARMFITVRQCHSANILCLYHFGIFLVFGYISFSATTCYSCVSVIDDAVYLYVAASFFGHRRVFNGQPMFLVAVAIWLCSLSRAELQCNLPERVVGPSPILHRKPPLLCLMAL